MFAVLFTGSYPRAIFDFSVGVLRWSFTLEDVPDYPARLAVEYPQSLSRGLVLVKWWLLALPQYLIVAALSSLLSLLVFIAGVVLSFTGRYPTSMFDLALGVDRGCTP